MVATKRIPAKVVTVESVHEMPAEPIRLEVNDLAALRMQAKVLAAQIKLAKANQPKQSKLESVIHLQTVQHDSSVDRKIANRVRARVKAGQSRTEAMDAVVEFYRNLADQRLDHDEMDAELDALTTDRREEEVQ